MSDEEWGRRTQASSLWVDAGVQEPWSHPAEAGRGDYHRECSPREGLAFSQCLPPHQPPLSHVCLSNSVTASRPEAPCPPHVEDGSWGWGDCGQRMGVPMKALRKDGIS